MLQLTHQDAFENCRNLINPEQLTVQLMEPVARLPRTPPSMDETISVDQHHISGRADFCSRCISPCSIVDRLGTSL